MTEALAREIDDSPLLPDLLELCRAARVEAEALEAAAKRAVAGRVAPGGKVDAALLEQEQFAAHG